MKSKGRIFTYQTRLKLDETLSKMLDDYASLFGFLERSLFKEFKAGKSLLELKSLYIKKFQITARQYNSLRVQLEGKIDSFKTRLSQRISNLKDQIGHLKQKITKLKKANLIHQKKRRLNHLESKLQALSSDQKTDNIRLCFGSKKLFCSQFHLEDNGYDSHEEWKKEWERARSHTIFLLGSKDETSGNQSCTATLQENGSLTIRLRLPSQFKEKYLKLENIHFNHGHSEIVKALESCFQRNRLAKLKDKNFNTHGQALSYRFHRDNKGWLCFISLEIAQKTYVTNLKLGAIGIDINSDHLALTETDRFGSPINKKTIALSTYGKSKNQSKAMIGNASAQIIEWSRATQKPLVIEQLDFSKKKTTLRETRPKYARLLSSFAYQNIREMIKSRAYLHGTEVLEVNPAFTSIIGQGKFAGRYGLSIHHAASLSIARRGIGVSERLPRHLDKIPNGKGGHVTLPLPVRNRSKHVWAQWGIIKRRLLAVLAAQTRATLSRSFKSSKSTCCDSHVPCFVGESPTCESSIKLLD